jgi:uncharacterized protein
VKTALLDLNILTALLWPTHVHHEAAHRWFSRRGKGRWATCPLTQLGFVRLSSNPAFSRDALTPTHAIALLEENLSDSRHVFWPDQLSVPSAAARAPELTGHRQVTDLYLLALAADRKGVLATFDQGLRALAGGGLASALEVVAP